MGANGAVFLPAAGYRHGTDVGRVGSVGYYWSLSAGSDYFGNANYLYFSSDDADLTDGRRYIGQSVRLVRSL
ncbi:MAG: hypothetical protein MJ204_09045 [Bacteroidales bacterium]|nr:hypothetical protein [Bacteroidales bacterium]